MTTTEDTPLFYHVAHDSAYQHPYTWAYRYEPSLSERGTRCDVCGLGDVFVTGAYPRFPLSAAVEGGWRYPDVLGSGEYPLLIVSEAMVEDWVQDGITGYNAYPLTIVRASCAAIRRQTPPQYFHIEVTGRCQLDTEAMGLSVVYNCPKCGYVEKEPAFNTPFIIRRDSWDGTDLFVSDLSKGVTFCTDRVRALAEKRKWTNVRFVLPERYWDLDNDDCLTEKTISNTARHRDVQHSATKASDDSHERRTGSEARSPEQTRLDL